MPVRTFIEAIREGLLSLLSTLERRRFARPDRVKTNRELADELAALAAEPTTLFAQARKVQVWLDAVESDSGHIMVSKRKADRIRGWERVMSTCKEDDRVRGKCVKKTKGGILVDIGVLPIYLEGDAAEGISCDFCHKIGEVILDEETGLPKADMAATSVT